MYTNATTLDSFHQRLPFTTNLFPQFPSSSPDICQLMIVPSRVRVVLVGGGLKVTLGLKPYPARGRRLTANKPHNGTHSKFKWPSMLIFIGNRRTNAVNSLKLSAEK